MRRLKTRYKKPHDVDANGECLNCKRLKPPCRCGSDAGRTCAAHDEQMRVTAVALRNTSGDLLGWLDVAECPRLGCGNVRSLKYACVPRRGHR